MSDVRAFFPCETVTRRWDGSIDLGRFGIESLTVPVAANGQPAKVQFAVLVRVDFLPAESGDHHLKIAFTGPDGNECASLDLDAKTSPTGISPVRLASGVVATVPTGGDYALDLLVDRQIRASWPLRVDLGSLPHQQGEGS